MSTSSSSEPRDVPASEEELRAAYEAEIKKVRLEHLLLENVVTLVNLGMRRTGLQPGTEDERDLGQVRLAIDAIRALLPLLERSSSEHVGPIRDALSQLQLAFVRIGGAGTDAAAEPNPADPQTGGSEAAPAPAPSGSAGAGGGPAEPLSEASDASKSGEPGPAQRSGRLWVPGQ